MLKFSPIFRKNFILKKRPCTLEVWMFWHAKTFLIFVKLWACKLCNKWKIFQNFYDNPNYYVSLVIFQTYKNVVFEECPLIWVAPLILFFPNHLSKNPYYTWMGSLVEWCTTYKINTRTHINKSHLFQVVCFIGHFDTRCGVHPSPCNDLIKKG
jgi:hypothetical protein